MPAGIAVEVADGFAVIEFVDKAKRGPALDALIKFGGPATVEKLSREKGSNTPRYRVPEGNAREVGLLDDADDTLSNVTTYGGTDATGIVLPEAPGGGLLHAPVIRAGTYSGGHDGGTVTAPADPVPSDIAAPTHAAIIEQVAEVQSTPVEPQGVEGGAYPAPEAGGAFIGMTGLQTAVAPSAPAEAPAEADAPAEPQEATGGDGGVVIDSAKDGDVAAAPAFPAGLPDEDWKRDEINAYAKSKGVNTSDPKKYPNKAAALAAIPAQ